MRTAGIAIVCALAALVLGIFLGGHPELLPGGLRDAFVEEDRALRAEIIDKIEDNFYKPVDEERLDDASLKGIVDSLEDPYSHYLTPTEARAVRESISGEFEGVGMTVEEDRRGLRVLSVFDESPAKRAGIAKGDLILAVNGRSIAGVNSEVATGRIKGPAGSEVRLEVFSPGAEDTRTVKVEREKIDVPVAEGRVVERGGRKVGVVELLGFSSGAHGALRREIDELTERGVDRLVLDLRGNGGGLLSEAVLVSSVFVEDGEIVSVRGRSRPERSEDAQGDAIDEDIPVVVLVDGGSASASEIVAGALRDRGRAKLVGTNTFGKGLVQEVEPLSNGGYLDLTVANYYLPGGKTIGEDGLKPERAGEGRSADPSATRPCPWRSTPCSSSPGEPAGRARRARAAPPRPAARGGARAARALPRGRAAVRPRPAHGGRARWGGRGRPRAGRRRKARRAGGASARPARRGARRARGPDARPRAAPLLRARRRGRGRGGAEEPYAADARVDLTALPTFTIDPDDARDFDDAISARREDGHVRVWVHIADVTAYLRPGGPLEREAYRRGTSVYVPGAVEPMLPEVLSNRACSLRPDEDKLAVTVEMEVHGTEVRSVSFHRARVRSDRRLTYREVDEIFAGRARAEEPWAGAARGGTGGRPRPAGAARLARAGRSRARLRRSTPRATWPPCATSSRASRTA